MQLDLEMERFPHTGGMDGDGAARLLGQPKLSPYSLLVRESIQNSWDARAKGVDTVDFEMNLMQLNSRQISLLRNRIFKTTPSAHEPLNTWINNRDPKNMLWISDRGTVGLRGPTRADLLNSKDDRNFCDLVRNLGRNTQLGVGGGTYGYGKSALYRVSSCSTVIFYSRIKKGKGFESRLIIGSWVGRFESKVGRKVVPYTGRMWWGESAKDGIVDPLIGDMADEIAVQLGATPFSVESTGTTIGIVGPDLNNQSAESIADEFVTSILWHCWPKMVKVNEVADMRFTVKLNGKKISMPSPESCPPLDSYVKAYKLALSKKNINTQGKELSTAIKRINPSTLLGRLGLAYSPRRERPNQLSNGGDVHAPHIASHHVALMRMPKLVVCYLPCPSLQTDIMEYGAVFIADESLERSFANAEPPSHDEWNPNLMSDEKAKSCVRLAIRRAQETVAEFIAPPDSEGNDGVTAGLGSFSMMLGGLVAGIPGSGAENPGTISRGGLGGGGTRGNSFLGSVDQLPAKLMQEEDELIAYVPFDAKIHKNSSVLKVQAKVGVGILDGNSLESEAPIGSLMPQIIGWISPSGQTLKGQDQIEISKSDLGIWQLKVLLPDDVQAQISIKVVA
jgi:hypothetical protein